MDLRLNNRNDYYADMPKTNIQVRDEKRMTHILIKKK